MGNQQHSFHLIKCPVGVTSSHACLVVSGHGVPHKTLTVFYEELQKSYSTATIQVILAPLLAFFSFLEQPEQEVCCSTPQSKQLPGEIYWAGSPSQLRAAIRAYLLTRWGCLTRPNGRQEEILLPPTMSETAEIQSFLAALQQFYHFALKRHDYWYESNPAATFHLPLRSHLWHALKATFRFPAPRHSGSRDEGRKEAPLQKSNPAFPGEELSLPAFPAEAWLQFVPVSEPAATVR